MTRNQIPKVNQPMQVGGDIFESMKSFCSIIQKNCGVRDYMKGENNCSDKDAPFPVEQKTNIRITGDCDMTQLNDTDIMIEGILQVRSNKGFKAAPGYDCLRVFNGVKNSNEMFEEMDVWNNTRYTNCRSQYSLYEGFVYSTCKAESNKIRKRNVNSPYENVHNFDRNICGTHSNPCDLFPTANSVAHIPFSAVIPINDISQFQLFEDWFIEWGHITLKIKMGKLSQVVVQVNPHVVAEVENYTNETISDEALSRIKNTVFKYNRKFVQQDLVGEFITYIGPHPTDPTRCEYTVEDVIFTVQGIEFTKLGCTWSGYNINERAKANIMSLWPPHDPLIIPGQELLILPLPRSGDKRKYAAGISHALRNVTDVIPIFYKNSGEHTCIENPMVQNLQIKIGNKLIPGMRLCTVGPHFMNQILQACDLDGYYEASKEFADSLIIPLNNPDGTPIIRTMTDQTSFLPVIQMERSGKGYFFDGFNHGDTPATIKLNFDPIYPGENDVYLDKATTAPQLWFVRTTFLTLDNQNGLRYNTDDTPEKYASDVVG
jgi:hypothetical protein